MDDNGWCGNGGEKEAERTKRLLNRQCTQPLWAVFTPLSPLCSDSVSGNTVNCLPVPVIWFSFIKFVLGVSVLRYWPDAVLHPLWCPYLGGKQPFHSSFMSTPSSNSVPLSLLGQSIQLGLMSPRAHTHTCVSCVAFPWQHQCETHSPLSTVPLICISFAWFASNQWHLTLAMANKLPWPRQSLSVCVAHPPHVISLLEIMSVIAACHPFPCPVIFPDFLFPISFFPSATVMKTSLSPLTLHFLLPF